MPRFLLVMLLCAGLLGCNSVFFIPYRAHVQTPENLGLDYDDVSFHAGDGMRLHAWFLPAQGKALATILFLHGNAENISTHIMAVRWLPAAHFNVLLLDYRGYGASEGVPTLGGVQDDVNSALKFLISRPDVDADRIIIFGQSLGGAIALYAAAHTPYRRHIKAVVVESAFASYRQIAREKLAGLWMTWPLQYPLSWTISDKYSPAVAVAQISPIPLLIMHGGQDSIVPIEHGRRLFELAREPKQLWVIPEGGHIQAFNTQSYRDCFVDFLSQSLKTPTTDKK